MAEPDDLDFVARTLNDLAAAGAPEAARRRAERTRALAAPAREEDQDD